jgi:hypothetical protein
LKWKKSLLRGWLRTLLLNPPPSDDNGGCGNEDQVNGRQDGRETNKSAPTGDASASSNSVTPNASSSGHVVRRVAGGGDDMKEYVSGSEIYDLLLKKGSFFMMGGLYGIVAQMRLLTHLGRRRKSSLWRITTTCLGNRKLP